MLKLLLIAIALLLFSCGKMAMGLMGVKDYDGYTPEQVINSAEKFNIPTGYSYIIDSAYYKHFGFAKRTDISGRRKDLFQPLQIRIYGQDGKLLGHRANCNVPGFPNLKWNGYGYFNAFPPTVDCKLIDTIQNLTLTDEFQNIQPLWPNTQVLKNDKKYSVFIYWSRFMNRQSKRLIRTIHKHYAAYNDSITYYYVNTEPLFY